MQVAKDLVVQVTPFINTSSRVMTLLFFCNYLTQKHYQVANLYIKICYNFLMCLFDSPYDSDQKKTLFLKAVAKTSSQLPDPKFDCSVFNKTFYIKPYIILPKASPYFLESDYFWQCYQHLFSENYKKCVKGSASAVLSTRCVNNIHFI